MFKGDEFSTIENKEQIISWGITGGDVTLIQIPELND
ncbi:hypothetical protein A6E11_07930 [Aliivibrio fischeri]|nr:hypothetical protein A6E11_07930 [Aliivibrio fischeri]OEE14668.1 hypothetical protein A1Q3_08720 [Aliivibrio fischeri ZF-211]OCH26635.1 hypothetical protein A6E12_12715 [Aliivibrio fischeri]OCH31265.1 hypothetical protein A6E13_17490 [Aliivibrio fischeri]OCH39533.1 hypothetical protein A6E02_17500 [Aliivibrio fischeri]